MWLVFDMLSRVLIDAGVANAILLSLVVVMMVVTRQPSRRIRLAQTGFYAALLMLPMVVFSPVPRLYPVDWMVRNGLMPPQLLPRSSQFATGDPLGRRFKARLGSPGPRPHSAAEWPVGEPLTRALTLFHLGGAALGIGWFGLGLWGFRRLLRRSREPSEAAQRIFNELLADLGRAPPHPSLRVSAWLRGPVLGGVARPCILIPERLDDEDVDPSSLRLILLHELAHADRGDVWFGALAGLCQSFWFFLPHLWWLRSQLRIDQEFLADRIAAGPIGDSTAYARWLVGLSSTRSAPEPAPLAAEPAERSGPPWWRGGFTSPLLQRVAMLLYCPFRVEEHPPAWYSIVMPALLMITAAGVSSFRLLAPLDPSALLHQSRASDPLVSSLNISKFVLVPGPTAVLPLALPPTFHLTADVLANEAALEQVRLSGHPLVAPDALADGSSSPDPDEPPTPHRIEMRRTLGGMTLTVDEVDVPIVDLHDEELDGPQWLTLTPPRDSTAVFRELLVTW
jgi:hypothetical protein